MDVDGINQVLRDVFGDVRTEVINGWVSIRCPISQWTHDRGKDSHASAGISIKPHGVSVFNCFTCGNKMPLHGLLRKYSNYTGEDLDSLIEELEEESYLGPREMPGWKEDQDDDTDPVPLKQSVYLDLYDSAADHPYLVDRGISADTAKLLQLMVDPSDPADGEERILFPVFGPNGDLYGLTGRATHKDARLKVRDYFGLKKAKCLLGAHLIASMKPKYVLIVEGLFDYANAWEQGQPAVAVMHSTLTPKQADILRDFSLPTYLFYDDDAAGHKGVANAGRMLYRYLPVMEVQYPDVVVPDGSPTGSHPLKDPGELLEIEFKQMIDGAKLYFPP